MTQPGHRRRRALGSFVFGSVVGGAIAIAAPRLRRARGSGDGPERIAGLEAFEGAPCWEYDHSEAPVATGDDSPE
jgi:hypothetical protein